MKVWLLTNTPSPYQLELLRHVQQAGDVDLTVRFMRGTHRGEDVLAGGGHGLDCRAMRGLGPETWRDELVLHPEALREAAFGEQDLVLLSGHYTSPTFLLAAAALRAQGRRWGMWLEQPWPRDYRPAWAPRVSVRFPLLDRLRDAVLSDLLRASSVVLCIGRTAARAYRRLGAARGRIAVLPYTCDVERFRRPDAGAVEEVRRRLPGRGVTFLCSGQLIPRKGVDLLLEAFLRVERQHPEVRLVLLGDGALRGDLEARAGRLRDSKIHFAGMRPQGELPAWFGAADAFVFPSRHDGWGVVVNEACGAGLPVVATRSTGAAQDLVRDGWNGFLLDRDDEEGLVKAMSTLAMDKALRNRQGARSRLVAERLTLDEGARRFRAAVELGLRGSRRRR